VGIFTEERKMMSEITKDTVNVKDDEGLDIIRISWRDLFYYPSNDLEWIVFSDGTLIKYEKNKLKLLKKGRSNAEESNGTIIFDSNHIRWVIMGEMLN